MLATVLLIGAVSTSAPRTSATSRTAAALTSAFGTHVRVAMRPGTDRVTFLAAPAGRSLTSASDDDASTTARSFVDRYGSAFGVDAPVTELTETRRSSGIAGEAVRYQQTHHGLPVFAGELAVQVGGDGAVDSMTGEVSPDLAIDVATRRVTAAAAAATALAVTAKYDDAAAATLTASAPQAWIYDPTLIGADDPGGARVVWRVQVRDGLGSVDRLVLIDANTGDIALTFSDREDVKSRQICDNGNAGGLSETCTSPVRTEPQGPTGNADVDSAYTLLGVVYDYYASMFGRDSVDDAGLPLRATVRYCPGTTPAVCPYKNAYWNGEQMVFGQGYAGADDVVGHELTHGVTQYTSGLLYYAESGAIDESMSDVMGELIDLSSTVSGPDLAGDRWKLGEQLPGGAVRDMANPTTAHDPDRMTSPLYWGASSDNYGVHTNSGVGNKAATLIADGGTFNGQTMIGLGIDKTARIYYQAETTLLGPGSDYLDLYSILPQACNALIGLSGITGTDCAQVGKAVTATEMNLAPTVAGAHLTAARCDAGSAPAAPLLADDMETNSGRWTGTATSGSAAWNYSTDSSVSGSRSLFAPDLGSTADAKVATTSPVAVTAANTYLWFTHSFELEFDDTHFWDGGVVEYSLNGSAGPWVDAGSLPGTINGYNAQLVGSGTNPLRGRVAFSGASPGYEQTRIDLSSLAGHNVSIRFRVGTDQVGSDSGWYVDDVAIYTCAAGPPPTTTGPATPGPVTASQPASAGAPAIRSSDSHPG